MTREADNSFRLLAAKYLRRHHRKLAAQVARLREPDDVERVHQARVAARRLRAALQLFADAFKARQVARWRKALRGLLKALGPARDLDVQIETVRGILDRTGDRELRLGIQRLLLRLTQQRDAMQRRVVKATDRFEKSNTVARMGSALKAATAGIPRGTALGSPQVFARTRNAIAARVRELIAFQACLANPQAAEQQHEMRIAAKHLRYTMEASSAAYGRELTPVITQVKRLQTLLGDLHDCDVWVADLERFVEQERRRTEVYFGHDWPFNLLRPGIEHLIAERRRERNALFGAVVRHWNRMEQRGQWGQLLQLLEQRAAPPPAATDTEALQPETAQDSRHAPTEAQGTESDDTLRPANGSVQPRTPPQRRSA